MRSPTHLFSSTAAAFLLAASPLPAAEPAAPTDRNVPTWAADAVWYQIFPERFRNGDPKNDPTRATLEPPVVAGRDWKISPWTADWYARDDWERRAGPDFYKHGVFERRYGGDLQGVIDKLDYLADLGVNALYFCPVFYARSMHKYDGSSYHHIDPHFGPDPAGDFALIEKETSDPATWHWTAADKLFLQLVKAAHAKKMRVIIDGVFNHTGRDFFAFQHLAKFQENSPYKDWYIVRSYDDPTTKRDEFTYDGWWGHKTLPVFAFTPDGKNMPEPPKRYIWDATRRWLNPADSPKGIPGAEGIDGWRLDVADERPNPFWADWNNHVRQVKPNAYTTAEVWKASSDLLVNGRFSGAMNYHAFAIPVKGWLVDNHLTPSIFAQMLDSRRAELPRPVTFAMQNLMDSHDTDRLASMIVNPRQGDSPTNVTYNGNNNLRQAMDYQVRRPNARERAIQRLVALFQMTYVGAPMIYYGTEAGMWGAHDPDNRMPMTWSNLRFDPQAGDPRKNPNRPGPDPVAFDAEVFDFYKRAIALRRNHPVLNRGDYQLLAADDDANTLAFARRSGGGEPVVALFNRSDREQTVTLRPPPGSVAGRGWLFRTEPTVLFSTGGPPVVDNASETFSVKLPPLTGVVLGPGT